VTGFWLLWDALSFRLVTHTHWIGYWEHAAVLAEWLRHPTAPTNPYLVDPALSAGFMPWYWLLSRLGIAGGIGAIELMAISALLNYLLIVVGLRLFVSEYFRDPWASPIAFIAVFMFWGVGNIWANMLQLHNFFYVAGYPATHAFALSLVAFWLTLKIIRNPGAGILPALLLAVVAWLMFLSQPQTGLFGVTGCALLAVTETAGMYRQRRVVLLSLVLALVATELWPYFSAWKLLLGTYEPRTVDFLTRLTAGVPDQIWYQPRTALLALGPALLGVPVCLWLLIRGRYPFIAWGAVLMTAFFLAGIIVDVPQGYRYLLCGAFFLQLALVWAFLYGLDAWRTIPRPVYAGAGFGIALAFVVVVLGGQVALLAMDKRGLVVNANSLKIQDRSAERIEGHSVADRYALLTDEVEEGAVVLTPAYYGWPLPVTGGKVVSTYVTNPLVADNDERYGATMRFFFKQSDAQQRADIIRRYNAEYLLIDSTDKGLSPALEPWVSEHALFVSKVGDLQLYSILGETLKPASEPVADEPEAAETDSGSKSEPMPSAEGIDGVTVAEEPAPQAESVQPAQSEGENFGAPITEPLITEPDGVTDPADYSQPDSETDQPVILPGATSEKESFGAPIQEPLLDPDRHGG